MKIHVYALGGLGENGKNMYVVDVDEQIFILDSGIKYPTSELFGVDEIVPDYRMLMNKKHKIKGIFMSHAHEDHIGAISHLLKDINVPIYATNFTMEIIKDSLKDKGYDLEIFEFITITPYSTIKFGEVKVTFFKTTHSIPESVGIVIQTLDGSIVYTSDFTFDQSNDSNYQTDFQKINEIGERKVLLLMVESINSTLPLDGRMNHMLDSELNRIISHTNERIIVSLFSSDLLKIQKVIDIALKYDKRIAIIGRKAQRIVDIAIKMNYLTIPENKLTNLRYIDDKNQNDDPDLVCLVTGDRHEPFYMLQRMVKKHDRLIHINENDTVIIVTSPIPGTEKMAAKTLDTLYRTDATIEVIDKSYLTINHATRDEIKMMISLLKPQYIMPVIGEYRMQYHLQSLAKEIGYNEKEVFLMNNGDVLRFTDGKPVVQRDRYRTGDILIDGSLAGDVNDIVIHDRELLSEDGALICIGHIDPKNKSLIGEVEVVMKGFMPEIDFEPHREQIKIIFKEAALNHFTNKYINWNDLKSTIRDDINKYLYKETKQRPVTIPVLISTEQGDSVNK
ncbi:MAG: ribonuclease J [Acholeplasmataceae bacterium]|nr:ribonuclease J [Acholeplasmataceae bacterium]MDD4203529.1 ribonuclease J [Acholeplasmataceae bacterium]MDD4823894.1 ribonuclease J [Acholeplasmataceae bacterium]